MDDKCKEIAHRVERLVDFIIRDAKNEIEKIYPGFNNASANHAKAYVESCVRLLLED